VIINTLKPSGNYININIYKYLNNLNFVFMGFVVNCVFFEVGTELINILRQGVKVRASLSEGRAGIAWVPSNNMFFLPLQV
jgi:hypothetical protein